MGRPVRRGGFLFALGIATMAFVAEYIEKSVALSASRVVPDFPPKGACPNVSKASSSPSFASPTWVAHSGW